MNTLTLSDVIAQTKAMIKESQETQINKDSFVIVYGKYVKESCFDCWDPRDLYAMTSKDLNQISTEINNIMPFPALDLVKLVSEAEANAYVDAHPYLYNGRNEAYLGCAIEMEEYQKFYIKHLQSNLQSLLALAN